MRLTEQQVTIIHNAIDTVLVDVDYSVALFGSRLNDKARGGDVDLVVSTPCALPLRTKARVQSALQLALQLPVDIVFYSTSQAATPFQRIALAGAQNISPVAK